MRRLRNQIRKTGSEFGWSRNKCDLPEVRYGPFSRTVFDFRGAFERRVKECGGNAFLPIRHVPDSWALRAQLTLKPALKPETAIGRRLMTARSLRPRRSNHS